MTKTDQLVNSEKIYAKLVNGIDSTKISVDEGEGLLSHGVVNRSPFVSDDRVAVNLPMEIHRKHHEFTANFPSPSIFEPDSLFVHVKVRGLRVHERRKALLKQSFCELSTIYYRSFFDVVTYHTETRIICETMV